jgi:hypothetical protein
MPIPLVKKSYFRNYIHFQGHPELIIGLGL